MAEPTAYRMVVNHSGPEDEAPDDSVPVEVYGLSSTGAIPADVSVMSSALPQGAATESGIQSLRAAIQNIPQATLDKTGLATTALQEDLLDALQSIFGSLQGTLAVSPSGTFTVSVPGSATASKQDEAQTALSAIQSLLGGTLKTSIDGSVSVTVTGGATSSGQTSANELLTTIRDILDGNLSVSGEVTVVGGPTAQGQADANVLLSTIRTLLQNPLTVNGPLAVTDNNSSLTVDGSVSVSNLPNPLPVTDNGGSLTVDGTVGATQSGTWNIGTLSSVTNPVAVTDNNGSLTVDGTVGISGTIPVSQSGTWSIMSTPNVSATSASLTPFRNTALTATPVQVKSSAGRIYQYSLANTNSVFVYVNIYNALAANVTPGTTAPMVTLPLPPGSTLDGYWSISHNWSTAITINASTNVNGSGAPTTGILVGLGYA